MQASKKKKKLKLYSELFINFLKSENLWHEDEKIYTFELPKRVLKTKRIQESTLQKQFISIAKEAHDLQIVTNSGYLWDTEQEAAIEKGNLVHLIMSKIKNASDIDLVFEEFQTIGDLTVKQISELKPLVRALIHHDQLNSYFQPNITIYNEKDIIASGGLILRPGRISINDQMEAVIIDYKTGSERPQYRIQLKEYQTILKGMGFTVSKKILVYINEDIQIKEI